LRDTLQQEHDTIEGALGKNNLSEQMQKLKSRENTNEPQLLSSASLNIVSVASILTISIGNKRSK